MEDAADTRRRISIIVAQTYQERRRHVVFSGATPKDSVVTFPSHPDHSFQHLRRLHHKGVQAVVEVVEGACQTEVRVPWSRWVETTPPSLPSQDEDAPQVTISPEVLARVEAAVQETAAVDVLSDDWGLLGLVDRSAALLLKPFNLPGRGTSPPRLPAFQGDEPEGEKAHGGEEGEDEEEEEEPSSPDVLKLQMLQRKMMRRIHERRAAARAAETVVQRFSRHYHARLAALGEGRGEAGGEEKGEGVKEEEEEEEQVEKEEGGEGEGLEQEEEDEDGEYESIGTPSVIIPSDDEGW